jgi:VIT1/CCC1 family predicted Fe2+/Mn2+ transporter
MIKRVSSISYFRNFIFGVEDGLVSTVGLISGIAVADVPKETIFVTGIILILVEAVSMAAASFLSENSANEYIYHKDNVDKNSIISSLIIFVSYFLSGMIPLLPYIAYEIDFAFKASIIITMISLVFLGLLDGKITKTKILTNIYRMTIVGGLAIAVGVIAGVLISGI